jgi:hypothetical protein
MTDSRNGPSKERNGDFVSTCGDALDLFGINLDT